MKTIFKNISILIITVCTVTILNSQNQYPEGSEEGLFTLKYSYYSLDVSTVIYKDSVYIPFTDFLNMMKIYYDFGDKSEIKGFVFNKDSSFSINTNKLIYLDINKNTHTLKPDDFVKTNLDIFILPSILESIFKISVYVKTRQLKIHIVSDYKFPLILEDERANKYSKMKSFDNLENEELPLLYGRDWSLIDGGMLDYNITGSQMRNSQSYGLGGSLGFQLFGGELQYNINTNFNVENKLMNKNDNYRWRYNFSENNYISQIAVGSITNSQSRGGSILNMVSNSRSLVGVQFSNESIRMPSAFSVFTIQDKIQPDWQVELFVGDQLYAQTRSDNLGYYQFDLPIKYGNTNIEIRIYGPHGEFISRKDIISVPGEILVPGEVKYNIGIGEEVQSKKYFGNALFSIGITDWFTNTINFEKEYDALGYNLVDNSSIRVSNNILFNTSISPDKYYKGGFRILFEDFGTYNLIYSNMKPNNYSANESHTLDFNGGLSRPFNMPINLTFRASLMESIVNTASSGNINLSFNFNKFYITTRYGLMYNTDKQSSKNTLNHSINYQIEYSWYKKPDFLSFLGNTRFSINSGYLFELNEITSVGFNISQEIAKIVNLNISSQYQPTNNQYSVNLNAMVNTSFFRMNSSMQTSPNTDNSYSQNLSGAVRFDSKRSKMFLSNNGGFNASSSGGATVRFYIDRNENGFCDETDQELDDGAIYIPGATIEKDKNGIKRVLNLLPGGRYNLYIKAGSFKNPNIVPKVSEFSFIADPNSMKKIDIPCYMTGMVEGAVNKIVDENTKEGQGGVKIHIKSRNFPDYHQIIPVFSDGFFLKNGLIPDKYVVYVDSTQLDLLECNSQPELIEFEVMATAEGDIIENLEFILTSRKEDKQVKTSSTITANQNSENENIEKNAVPINNEIKPKTKSVDKNSNSKVEDKPEPIAENIKNLFPKLSFKHQVLVYSSSKVTFLSNQMKRDIDKIAQYLIENPKANLRIEGHSDNSGLLDEQQRISEARAYEIKTYLFNKGIDKTRLFANGKGSLFPMEDNSTAAGRRKNSRVELKIID